MLLESSFVLLWVVSSLDDNRLLVTAVGGVADPLLFTADASILVLVMRPLRTWFALYATSIYLPRETSTAKALLEFAYRDRIPRLRSVQLSSQDFLLLATTLSTLRTHQKYLRVSQHLTGCNIATGWGHLTMGACCFALYARPKVFQSFANRRASHTNTDTHICIKGTQPPGRQ